MLRIFLIELASQNSNFFFIKTFPGHFHKVVLWTLFSCTIEIVDIFTELSQTTE